MILDSLRLQVLEGFLRDYDVSFTGSIIARKKNQNQKSVANVLREFEMQSVLKSTTQGKNKLYSLNLDDSQMIVSFISMLEHMRTLDFYKRQPLIKEISKKIIPYCDGPVAIFGSYAKGIQKKGSDLDVFVAGRYDHEEIKKISAIYKIDINVKNYPPVLFKKSLLKKDHLLEEVKKDHILIWDVQRFVSYVMEFGYGKD
ncbi:MAG: nucleotidyltransferase domain-containing protein [Candidatus Aenigmarchaeota archaeon]|nr:nucleotidyltransferase domain-containing protein [Candidatus Aenigmarchaeota archaeon]